MIAKHIISVVVEVVVDIFVFSIALSWCVDVGGVGGWGEWHLRKVQFVAAFSTKYRQYPGLIWSIYSLQFLYFTAQGTRLHWPLAGTGWVPPTIIRQILFFNFDLVVHLYIEQGVPKKMSFSGKTAITNIQTHPKCKNWGCFGKFRIFATKWALRFSKLKKKWLSCELPTPIQKWAEFFALNIHWLILSTIHEGIMVLELDTSGQGYKTAFTLPSTNVWNKFCFHCKSWKCRG